MTIDSHAGAQERGAKGAEPGGPESAGSGRDGLINSDGWDLLVEAAARFREYEDQHRQRALGFAEKAACAAGWRAEEWRKDELASVAKAERNGEIAARIEGWLIVNDPEMQRLGAIWRGEPAAASAFDLKEIARLIEIGFVERTMHHPVSAYHAQLAWLWPLMARTVVFGVEPEPDATETLKWGEPVHPVDALKSWAQAIGYDLDPAWEARARAHCDEMVEVPGTIEERPDDAHPGVSIGQVHDIVPGSILLDGQQPPAGAIVERHPAAEGLEPYHHRPDCECALCWPVVHVTGGLPGGAK